MLLEGQTLEDLALVVLRLEGEARELGSKIHALECALPALCRAWNSGEGDPMHETAYRSYDLAVDQLRGMRMYHAALLQRHARLAQFLGDRSLEETL